MPMAGGTAKTRFCQTLKAMYGLSTQATSKAGIGTGKCIEFQNQKRFSSASLRASWKSAWYGYISSHPSQPGGVSISYGLGNAELVFAGAAIVLSSVGVRPVYKHGMAPSTMRIVRQTTLGGPEVLEVVDAERPEPIPTEVLVRVRAAGVNPVDWKTRERG